MATEPEILIKPRLKDKIRGLFDSRATWLVLGSIAGTLFGEPASNAVSAIGLWVMAVL